MRIPRIFTGQDINAGVTVQLEAGASQHLSRALRLNVGDSLCLFDGSGREWPCQITSVERKQVSVMPAEPLVRDLESPLTIHLGIAISRGDRMDMVIQKSTELGVTTITPILTERTEVKLKGEREQKKLQHWRQITISACEQSGRNILPELHSPRPVGQWLQDRDGEQRFVLHHRGAEGLNTATAPTSVDLLIGPEGGLTPDEIDAAAGHGFQPLTLGPRVLRTETAPLAAIAILQARWGDMNPSRNAD